MDTRIEYQAMIRNLVEEIQQRLDSPPGFRELADRACLSPYYFHRLFRAMVGESPAELVRRLKLERAAWQLKSSSTPITEIAFDAGYATHEAFTKAFQSEYGTSPSHFRSGNRENGLIPSRNNIHFHKDGFTLFNLIDRGELKMIHEVVETSPKRLACLRHKGAYHDIGASFGMLGQKAGPLGLFGHGGNGVAVYLDDPESTPVAELNSLAGVVVPDGVPIGDLEEFNLPGGKFLRAEYIGHYSGLGEAWSTVFGKIIPEEGLQLRDGTSYEIYVNDCNTTPVEKLQTDIYVPVQ